MLKPILMAGLLGVNLSAWAVVDWTPYLKSIKDECKVFEVEQALGGGKKAKIYKKLQPSITKYTHTVEKTDVRLKNATAFGQPITRIVVEHPKLVMLALPFILPIITSPNLNHNLKPK